MKRFLMLFLLLPVLSFGDSIAEDVGVTEQGIAHQDQVLQDKAVQEKAHQEKAKQIEYEFFSPFCPGRALADCPSSKANELKKEILNMVVEGKSKDQVLDFLKNKFGEEYISRPPFSGFASLAWLIPIGFLFLAVGIAVWVASRWKKKS